MRLPVTKARELGLLLKKSWMPKMMLLVGESVAMKTWS